MNTTPYLDKIDDPSILRKLDEKDLPILANEVRSESLKIIVHKRVCLTNQNCKVSLLSQTKIKSELHSTILRKAAILEKESKKKKKK